MPLGLEVVTEKPNIPAKLAVAVAGAQVTHSDEQRHIAFVAERDDVWYLIHLAWQDDYRLQVTSDPDATASAYCHTPLTVLDEENRDVFVEWLFALHAQTGGRIPYSIDIPHADEVFDADGKIKTFGAGEGFTCASFVKCTLEHYGIRLLDDRDEAWPVRPQDSIWQTKIIDLLKRRAPAASIASQQQLIGKVARFRPEEVLGAAYELAQLPLTDRVPLPLVRAEPLGLQAVDELRQLMQ